MGRRARVDDGIDRHFNDNVEAQKAIAGIAGVIMIIGFTTFAVAAFLLISSGVQIRSGRQDCPPASVTRQVQPDAIGSRERTPLGASALV